MKSLELGDYEKMPQIWVSWIPVKEQWEKGGENIIKETIQENFPEQKDKHFQFDHSYQVLSKYYSGNSLN